MRGFVTLLFCACSGSAAVPASPNTKAPPADPVDPRTIVLASTTDLPYGVAVDEVNVYFSLVDTGIRRTPKLGGPIDDVVLDDHGPHPLVVDDVFVYAADLGTPAADFVDGRIVRVPKAGGALQILVSDLGAPDSLVLHEGDVVFSASGTRSFGAYNNDGAIYRVPRDGSAAPTRLAKNQRHPICVAVDDTYVYWTNDYAGTIVRCALSGCNQMPEVLYDNQNVPHALVVDDTYLYWTNQMDTNVVRAPKQGGGEINELAGSRGFPESLVLDRGMLYWTEVLTHTIQSMPKGGAPRPIAVAQEPDVKLPQRIAVDATSLYFTDQGIIDVVRVPR